MASRIQMNITADTDIVARTILIRAIQGLERTSQFTLGRAKHHAPVRAIFQRSRRGPPIPKGRDVAGSERSGWRYIRSERQYNAFLASKERSTGMNIPGGRMRNAQGGGTMRETYTRRRPDAPLIKERHTRITSRNSIGGPGGAGFGGHRNSLFPVFRHGRLRVTGDFRNLSNIKQAYAQRPYGSKAFAIDTSGKRGILAKAKQSLPLSAAGRREVRRATPGSRSQRLAAGSGLYNGRVGGRLKGELRVTGPVQQGATVWMYVESPTPYAVHQEFGTTRHQPQPFLRPALYESRNVLRQEVRKAISNPRKRLDRSDDPRTSFKKRAVS
jgi:HK97 gp10 family phage protein